jgi:hypothetical protein
MRSVKHTFVGGDISNATLRDGDPPLPATYQIGIQRKRKLGVQLLEIDTSARRLCKFLRELRLVC